MSSMSLFDSLDTSKPLPGQVTVEKRKVNPEQECAERLWKSWVSLTGRPESDPPRKFVTTVANAMRKGVTANMLTRRVSQAIYLPAEGDRDDTTRVTKVISGTWARRAAEAAVKSEQMYYYHASAESADLDSVATALGILSKDLTGEAFHDLERLAGTISLPDIVNRCSQLRQQAGLDPSAALMPDEVLSRRVLSRHRTFTTRTSDDTGLARSSHERELLPETLWMDPVAERLLLTGASPDKVAAFHNDTPEGFWEAVAGKIESGSGPSRARAAVEREMDFRLDMRTQNGGR